MTGLDPRSLTEAITAWHDFYNVLGEAAATMIALLFVAASVGSDRFAGSRATALRMFLSASVVHFASVLTISLLTLTPLHDWTIFGSLIIAAGLFGLFYAIFTWFGAVRDGLSKRIDREDRIWYAALPILGALLECAAGVGLLLHLFCALPALAIAAGFLMLIAIHNAWDITIWSIATPPKE